MLREASQRFQALQTDPEGYGIEEARGGYCFELLVQEASSWQISTGQVIHNLSD